MSETDLMKWERNRRLYKDKKIPRHKIRNGELACGAAIGPQPTKIAWFWKHVTCKACLKLQRRASEALP